MHFTYCVTGVSLFSTNQTRGMYSIELPFTSGVHLLGCATDSDMKIDIQTLGSSMERVELEGDYSNYFTLYADKKQDAKNQYVLDPKAMLFTVDFCRNYNWEIIDDTLYFMNYSQLPSLDIVDEFVSQIRPAVETPSDRRANPYRMSYTDFSGRTILCPLCSVELKEDEQWLECPNEHGGLVTGSQLMKLRQNLDANEHITAIDNGTAVGHAAIVCPYCSSKMEATKYQSTNTEIDVCTKCMFRWVDSGELKLLANQAVTVTPPSQENPA